MTSTAAKTTATAAQLKLAATDANTLGLTVSAGRFVTRTGNEGDRVSAPVAIEERSLVDAESARLCRDDNVNRSVMEKAALR
jgi:hypothetical protein